MAGEILQRFVNYVARGAVHGDYSRYTGKPLRDFIRERNRRGTEVALAATLEEAPERLAS